MPLNENRVVRNSAVRNSASATTFAPTELQRQVQSRRQQRAHQAARRNCAAHVGHVPKRQQRRAASAPAIRSQSSLPTADSSGWLRNQRHAQRENPHGQQKRGVAETLEDQSRRCKRRIGPIQLRAGCPSGAAAETLNDAS